jgi:hypothetical protein
MSDFWKCNKCNAEKLIGPNCFKCGAYKGSKMKALSLALLSVLVTACGQDPLSAVKGVVGSTVPTAACSLLIVGQFQNMGDGMTVTVGERNGECGIEISCGFKGYVYSLGGNNYRMIANLAENDTYTGCGLPAQGTSYMGKGGPFYDFGGFGNYNGQWLGEVVPINVGNQWNKLQ